jgi:hypothetical protein
VGAERVERKMKRVSFRGEGSFMFHDSYPFMHWVYIASP